MKANTYKTIINSIPPLWKNRINTESQKYDHNKAIPLLHLKNNQHIQLKDLTPKAIYKIMSTQKKQITSKSFITWQYIFNSMSNISQKEWSNLFKTMQNNKNNNKADEVRYKLIHHKLPTNDLFKRRGCTNNDLCPQCMENIETLPHMVYNCKKVQPLIKYAIALIHKIYPHLPRLKNTFKSFLFSSSQNVNIYYIGNMILNELLYKIYCNRLRSFHDKVTFSKTALLAEFKNKIKKILNEERQIAREKNYLCLFLEGIKKIWCNTKETFNIEIR